MDVAALNAIWVILGLMLIALGFLGALHPAIPGLPLMFGGVWLIAWAGHYEAVGPTTLWILAAITAVGMLLDYVAALLGAKFTGASKEALWGSLAGGLIGIFLGLPGLILGPLLGAAAGEFIARKDVLRAGTVGLGTFIGFVAGVVAKLGIGLVLVLTLAGMEIYHWLHL